MATYVQFCIHHYVIRCNKCGFQWSENNEQPLKAHDCPKCESYKIEKIQNVIEVWDFRNIKDYERFEEYNREILISDII